MACVRAQAQETTGLPAQGGVHGTRHPTLLESAPEGWYRPTFEVTDTGVQLSALPWMSCVSLSLSRFETPVEWRQT